MCLPSFPHQTILSTLNFTMKTSIILVGILYTLVSNVLADDYSANNVYDIGQRVLFLWSSDYGSVGLWVWQAYPETDSNHGVSILGI